MMAPFPSSSRAGQRRSPLFRGFAAWALLGAACSGVHPGIGTPNTSTGWRVEPDPSSELRRQTWASPQGQGSAVLPGGSREGANARPELGLPFSLRVTRQDVPPSSIDDFPVAFAEPCITSQAADAARPRLAVHLQGGFAHPNYELRVRLDGHTSKPLFIVRRRPSDVSLASLLGEWGRLEPGQHEVFAFARGKDGLVPQLPGGGLALLGCRFRLDGEGNLAPGASATRDSIVLLAPEGTLNGKDADAPSLQIAGAPGRSVLLRLERPDGGGEEHLLSPGRFTVFPLVGGDYGFSLGVVPEQAPSDEGHRGRPSKPDDPSVAATPRYQQWITVNPE